MATLLSPLAVSLGDPAGIGPEVIAKCWDNRSAFALPPFVAIGDPRSLAAVWDGPIELGEALRGLQRNFGIPEPRLAVSGLNPHAGEGGQLGTEEIEMIEPAIAALAAEGWRVTGPHPADTMFHTRARANYDAALCMYHDQALIPIKALHFEDAVNVTLGLPIVRTAPDHGTAFDIAGQDRADPRPMAAAIRMAAEHAIQPTETA